MAADSRQIIRRSAYSLSRWIEALQAPASRPRPPFHEGRKEPFTRRTRERIEPLARVSGEKIGRPKGWRPPLMERLEPAKRKRDRAWLRRLPSRDRLNRSCKGRGRRPWPEPGLDGPGPPDPPGSPNRLCGRRRRLHEAASQKRIPALPPAPALRFPPWPDRRRKPRRDRGRGPPPASRSSTDLMPQGARESGRLEGWSRRRRRSCGLERPLRQGQAFEARLRRSSGRGDRQLKSCAREVISP